MSGLEKCNKKSYPHEVNTFFFPKLELLLKWFGYFFIDKCKYFIFRKKNKF